MPKEANNWIKGFLQYTDNTEPPALFREWVAMSVIAAALKRKTYLQWGRYKIYPNLYVMLIAPPGTARKSTSMEPGEDMLKDIGVKLAPEATTRESLIRSLAEATDTEIDVESGDMIMHSSLTIFNSEIAVLFGNNNTALIAALTDWYDCKDRWRYETKGSGKDDINGVYVNLLGATTPDALQRMFPKELIGGGLSSRIIYVYEEKMHKPVVFPFLQEEDEEMKELLKNDLERIQMMKGDFLPTDGFLDLWAEWYLKNYDKRIFSGDPNFQGYASRRPAHVRKLAIIMSAATRRDQAVTRQNLADAIDLLERTEVKMPRVFSGYGLGKTSDVTSRIMDFIAAKGKTDTREILTAFYADLDDIDTLEKVLKVLSSIDFIDRITGSDGITKVEFNREFKGGAFGG